MQTIRGIFLIVSSFIMSVCSLTQEQNSSQHLFIVDEITFDSYTLNSFSQSESRTDLATDVNNKDSDNSSFEVKTIQPILMITKLDADDLLVKPYVLSAL